MNEKLNQARNNETQALNWLKKQIAENWRLILVAAIVVVISLNSFQNEKNSGQNNQPSPSVSTQAEQNNTNNSENTVDTNNTANTDTKTPESVSARSNNDQNGVAQTAQKGEGMTHLARRAVKGYLEQNSKTLTSEQKIYAEDYVRKNTTVQKVQTGNTITFSEETIKTAVEKAEALTEKQIKNLEKFVPLVKNL